MMNATEYKKYHESYMLNNHGSSAFHTFFCIFFTVQSCIYVSIQTQSTSQYIYEYMGLVLPMILAHTVLPEYILILNSVIMVILIHQFIYYYKNVSEKFNSKNVFKNDRITLISSLRALTYLITGLCILAVDFRDFPRYLAKTERFGYSLMDTGVGLFITMSGLVHKDLRKSGLKVIVRSNFKITAILLFLGVGRFISVKVLDYQEHITEYGVHWNFFFTVAVCKILSTILLYLSDRALLLSIITLIVHELLLNIGVKDWVFSDSLRNTLISANREGISSSLGFVSIYLFSVHIKYILLDKNVTKYETLKKLFYISLLLWVLTSWHLVCPTSRTLANAGYCLFMDAILVTITTVKYFVTVLCTEKNDINLPQILLTINTNGLSYFLICNLCTGIINLSIRTLFVSSTFTCIILNVYMIVTLSLTVVIKKMGIKI